MKKVQVELGPVTKHNVKMVKRLNQVIFPVSYNDQFYADLLKAGDLAKIAYYNDLPVGAVCCRPDTAAAPGTKKLYIMTLGCLAPYRRHKVGTVLLQHVLELCAREGYTVVSLHVQVNNESALEFYKKFGFEVVGTSEQYYKRIEPADAFVLEKRFEQGAESDNGERRKALTEK